MEIQLNSKENENESEDFFGIDFEMSSDYYNCDDCYEENQDNLTDLCLGESEEEKYEMLKLSREENLLCASEENKINEKEVEYLEEFLADNNDNKKLMLDVKSDVMKIISCQNFVNGFREINDKTEIIKNKYILEFEK